MKVIIGLIILAFACSMTRLMPSGRGEILDTIRISVGQTTSLNDTLYSMWISSDVSIATIGSANGTVTGVTAGTAEVAGSYVFPVFYYPTTYVIVTP
jgi:hypothetical protein